MKAQETKATYIHTDIRRNLLNYEPTYSEYMILNNVLIVTNALFYIMAQQSPPLRPPP
jgi:hypothetical protein